MKSLTAKNLKDIAQYLIIFTVVIAMLTLITTVFKHELPAGNKDIGNILIGVLATKFSDVIGYLINSTKGSAEKTDLIAKSPALKTENND